MCTSFQSWKWTSFWLSLKWFFFVLQAENVSDFDFLKEEIGYRMADRVLDLKRQMDVCVDIGKGQRKAFPYKFTTVLNLSKARLETSWFLGSGRGYITRHLTNHSVKKVIATEMSQTYLKQCQPPDPQEVSVTRRVHQIWSWNQTFAAEYPIRTNPTRRRRLAAAFRHEFHRSGRDQPQRSLGQ